MADSKFTQPELEKAWSLADKWHDEWIQACADLSIANERVRELQERNDALISSLREREKWIHGKGDLGAPHVGCPQCTLAWQEKK